MKKVLFSAYSLDIGGIETALLTLLNELAKKRKYKITLALEEKQGVFLNDLDKRIKVIQYKPSACKVVFIRKAINLLKQICFFIGHKNRYDFAASYATYSIPGSFVARTASKNNAIWIHSNYKIIYPERDNFRKFFNNLKIDRFKKIIFVSKNSKEAFLQVMSNLENKCLVINNIIDYEKIQKLSEEKIEEKKDDIPTFLYVGRLTEDDKRISRILDCSRRLRDEKIRHKIYIIGEGKERANYISAVRSFDLEDTVYMLGKKKNPYPYFKISDYLLLTSEYEGFPVVYNEAKILKLPVITTDVSDAQEIIGTKYGIVVDKNSNAVYAAMKHALEKGLKVKSDFNPKQYNEVNLEMVEVLLDKGN